VPLVAACSGVEWTSRMDDQRKRASETDLTMRMSDGAQVEVEFKLSGGGELANFGDAVMSRSDHSLVIFRDTYGAGVPSVIPSAEGRVSFRGLEVRPDVEVDLIPPLAHPGSRSETTLARIARHLGGTFAETFGNVIEHGSEQPSTVSGTEGPESAQS
jgi:hypothetical protein